MTSLRATAAAMAVLAAAAGCVLPPAGAGSEDTPKPAPTRTTSAKPTSAPAAGTAAAIRVELAKARVVTSRPEAPGYARDAFGARWTDQHTGLGGHNGCGTRDDVLARQLTDVQRRSGSKCVVESGTLTDPYTGRRIEFRKSEASKVQIDHIYPLARAWDLGASRWSKQHRTDFANDQAANLLAVDGATNASKSDKGPGEWMPVAASYRCTYVLRYLQVANTYKLAITRDDRDAALAITPTCGSR